MVDGSLGRAVFQGWLEGVFRGSCRARRKTTRKGHLLHADPLPLALSLHSFSLFLVFVRRVDIWTHTKDASFGAREKDLRVFVVFGVRWSLVKAARNFAYRAHHRASPTFLFFRDIFAASWFSFFSNAVLGYVSSVSSAVKNFYGQWKSNGKRFGSNRLVTVSLPIFQGTDGEYWGQLMSIASEIDWNIGATDRSI